MKRAAILFVLLASVAAAVSSAEPPEPEHFVALGVDLGDLYENEPTVWGGYLADTALGGRFRLVAEAMVGNGLKSTEGDRGEADKGFSWRSGLSPVWCRSKWCAGPSLSWSGYRSEWNPSGSLPGLVWDRDTVRLGGLGGWRTDDVRVWLRLLEDAITADLVVLTGPKWGGRLRVTCHDGDCGLSLQLLRGF